MVAQFLPNFWWLIPISMKKVHHTIFQQKAQQWWPTMSLACAGGGFLQLSKIAPQNTVFFWKFMVHNQNISGTVWLLMESTGDLFPEPCLSMGTLSSMQTLAVHHQLSSLPYWHHGVVHFAHSTGGLPGAQVGQKLVKHNSPKMIIDPLGCPNKWF